VLGIKQLVLHPSRVFSRDELLHRIWGENCALEERAMDVQCGTRIDRQLNESIPMSHNEHLLSVGGIDVREDGIAP
jgi:DNA-binding response OmpR family regulator